MVVDKSLLEEFPFKGAFYEMRIDENLPADEQEEEKVLVCEVECDIQESNKTFSAGNITSSYSIYFPFAKDEGLKVRKGMIFEGDFYGSFVSGPVIGIYPSQLGKCVAYLEDFDV